MKKIYLIALALFFTNLIFSQDQLFKKDNSKLDVKILEVTHNEIHYKLLSNLEGPTYITAKSEIALIIYKNGEHETFKEQKTQVPTYTTIPNSLAVDSFFIKKDMRKQKRYEELAKNKNIVFLNAGQLFNGGIGIEYMREFKNNIVLLHVPTSFSFGVDDITVVGSSSLLFFNIYDITNYQFDRKVYDLGLGVYFNTSSKRAFTHFIGPLFRFARFNGSYERISYSNTSSYGFITDKYYFVLDQNYGMLNNGFLYRITPHFNIMFNVALGVAFNRRYLNNDPAQTMANASSSASSTSGLKAAAQIGFSFGYRF